MAQPVHQMRDMHASAMTTTHSTPKFFNASNTLKNVHELAKRQSAKDKNARYQLIHIEQHASPTPSEWRVVIALGRCILKSWTMG